MQLGGLGRMGANMVRRLIRGGHECVVYDRSRSTVEALAKERAVGSFSLNEFVSELTPPRAVWLVVPAAFVDDTLGELAPLLSRQDIVVDGGNSYYIDDVRRHQELAAKGIHHVDVGTSGGVWGLERSYCMMIGGPDPAVERLDPVLRTLAPGRDSAPTSAARGRRDGTAEEGYLHCGPAEAGHFVKMVSQRDRVRAHGNVCRRFKRAKAGKRWDAKPVSGRGNHSATQTRVLPIRI